MSKRLLIDTDAKTDANNLYLPETATSGGNIAIGGSIKVTNLTFDNPTLAKPTSVVDLTTFTDFATITAGSEDLVDLDFVVNETRINTETPVTGLTLSSNDTEGLIALIKGWLDGVLGSPYTYDTWVTDTTWTGWEVNLDDVTETLSIRVNNEEFSENGSQFKLVGNNDITDYTIGSSFFDNGVGTAYGYLSFDIGTDLVDLKLEGVTDYTETDDIDTIISTFVSKLNTLSDFTPDGATAVDSDSDTNFDTIDLETNTNAIKYNNQDITITSEATKAKTDIAVTEDVYADQTLTFNYKDKSIDVTIPDQSDSAGVITAIETAFTADATWDFELVEGTLIAKQVGQDYNGTVTTVSDSIVITGANVTELSSVGNYSIVVEGGANADTITTSDMTPLSGGLLATTSLTSQLAPVAKRRKLYVDDKIYLNGFGGYILVDSFPETVTSQDSVLSIDNNITDVVENQGLGFEDLISSIETINPYYNVFFRVVEDGIGNRSISNDPTDHVVIKIWENVGGLLNVSRVYFDDPMKTTDGWKFTGVEETIIEDADSFTSPDSKFFVFTYPEQGAGLISLSLNTDDGGNIGTTIVSKILNNQVSTDIDTDLTNKAWVRGIISNDDTQVSLGVIKTEGD